LSFGKKDIKKDKLKNSSLLNKAHHFIPSNQKGKGWQAVNKNRNIPSRRFAIQCAQTQFVA